MKRVSINELLNVLLIVLAAMLGACTDDDPTDGPGDDTNPCIPSEISDADIIAYTQSDVSRTNPAAESNLESLLHYNINVSDFETSKKFYKLLGFMSLVDLNINVTDPAEAQGLDLPPYSLKTVTLRLRDGFIVDLIMFKDPFDGSAPHSDSRSLGMTTMSLKTDNLKSDMSVFTSNGIAFAILNGTAEEPKKIRLEDPDGTIIYLTQVFEDKGKVPFGKTYVHGLFTSNINVSDLAAAVDFYKEVGFSVTEERDGVATIAMGDGRHMTLTSSCSANKPYDKVNHLGIARMAIRTNDLDGDIERLKSKGIKLYTSEAVSPSGPFSFIRYVCFEDLDGTVIELVDTPI